MRHHLASRSGGITLALALMGISVLRGATGDEHWDSQFGWPGVTNIIFTLGSDGTRLLVGGLNGAAGATNSAIDVWDGNTWSVLEYVSGGAKIVQDFARVGTDLYVGGSFSRVGGLITPGLARWNGTAWSNVGGFGGAALALEQDGTGLIVGGVFTNVGGQLNTNIARWNGANWEPLGHGLGPYSSFGSIYVYDILATGSEIFAAGNFTTSGTNSVRYLARWDGTTWSEVGGGINGEARALWREGTDVYVAGNFTVAGGVTVNRIAKWNGSTWSALGSGMDATVESIAFYGGQLYAAGSFTTAGGIPAARITRWNGVAWTNIGTGLSAAGVKLLVHQSKLYVGGTFNLVDGIIVGGVGCWDGTRWTGLGVADRIAGLSSTVRAFAGDGNQLYAGGAFTGAGTVKAHRIAKWDGRNWSPLGSGFKGVDETTTAIHAIAISGSNLYAGGIFTNAGGTTANNIARWDGLAWRALGSGVPGTVSAIATRGNEVYVGGIFTMDIGTQTAFNIAKWDGTAWSKLPGDVWAGTIGSFTVRALAVRDNDLYVGGSFFAGNFSGQMTTNIARHNGSDWMPLGTGVNSNVNAIVVIGADVYAAGRVTSASGVPANRIAKWNGATWSALGSGVNDIVNALTVLGTNLCAGGSFSMAGAVNAARVARWDGSAWSALGSGVYTSPTSGSVNALAGIGNDLFVGGSCRFAGTNRSYFVARWNDNINFAVSARIFLSNSKRTDAGGFRFTVTAMGVPSYVIERTSDFTSWLPVHTNTLSPLDYTDTQIFPYRFYRAVGR